MSENNTPQTGQTVQNGKEHTPFIELACDSQGKWHWVLWSANGRQVARNAVEYDRKKDAIQALKAIKEVVPKVKIVVQCHEK